MTCAIEPPATQYLNEAICDDAFEGSGETGAHRERGTSRSIESESDQEDALAINCPIIARNNELLLSED